MGNFYQRLLTGFAIITVITSAVMHSIYSLLFLCLAINLLGLWEFYKLFHYTNDPTRKTLGILLSVFLLMSICLWSNQQLDAKILLINIPFVSVIFVAELYLRSATPFVSIALLFLGLIYITLPSILLFACAVSIPKHLNSQEVVLGYFFLLWANDTGAYVAGSLLGRNSLFSRISPNKTWEGSAGGAFLVIVIVHINYTFLQELSFLSWSTMGGVVIVMGTFGDLVKSLMKRSLNKKDSGNFLPGHGGILDRFDSLLGSVPWIYAYLILIFRD